MVTLEKYGSNHSMTAGQRKYLVKMLRTAWRNSLYHKIKTIRKIQVSSHIMENGREFDKYHILETLKNLQVKDMVEFNITGNDKRVLVRSHDAFPIMTKTGKKMANIVFSISLQLNKLITVWYNFTEDNHNTLNMANYGNHTELSDKDFIFQNME